jgi:predicted O-methyltransferase YrrM
MSQEQWTVVDRYLNDRLALSDAALDAALAANTAAGLPAIDVTANQGKFLHMLALLVGAKRILEIGTLGGYSTIWMARALPADGRLVTLEVDPKHAEVAQSNIARAGLAELVDIRLGPAVESLVHMEKEGAGPFDLFFIDADKESCGVYLSWALKLCRKGSLIVCDNIVREGAIADIANTDPRTLGVRAFLDMAVAEPRLLATALQTVGTKGYDGFAIALVVRD